MVFTLKSSAFTNGSPIPDIYARDGGNQSPPLQWDGEPSNTKSFALLVEDWDAPFGAFTHWAVFDIPANCDHLPQGLTGVDAQCGVNDFGDKHYDGPAPPTGHGIHRYHFRLCALDVATLRLPDGTHYTEIKSAVRPHVLAEATLVGTYEARSEPGENKLTPERIDFVAVPGLIASKTFSQAVIASGSRFVFTSGQVAVDVEGNLLGGKDLADQTKHAMNNVELALRAAGASFADVVKTTTFVVGYKPDQREIITTAKAPFYSGRLPPTSALIGVSALARPEWLIEIEAIAILV